MCAKEARREDSNRHALAQRHRYRRGRARRARERGARARRGVSAFALAAARLGWPLAECDCISLHGRPFASLVRHLAPDARILALSNDGATPAAIAELLVREGYGPSRMTVFEHLAGPAEHRIS